MKDPVTVEVARQNATAENVKQTVYRIEESEKNAAVEYLLKDRSQEQVLIFSNTKAGASRLARQLERKGLKASAIHGDKTQAERMATLEAFKSGSIDILVATDVAARGLHIEELPCVINFDLPFVAEDYVHRIGRTGRAGSKGEALSLYSEKDERLLKEIEKLTKRQLPLEKLPGLERGKHTSPETGGTAYGKRFDRSPYKSVGLEKKSKDPWFDQPYVPSTTKSETDPDKPALKTVKKPIAALLGGLPKPKK